MRVWGGARLDRLGGRGGRSGGEGDCLACELLELADQVVFLAVPVAVGLVEVGTQIAVAGLGVGQQVPHDGQDRVANRDKGALLATAFGDAAVALAEEGVAAPGGDGDLAEGGGKPRVALPVTAVLALPAELLAWGANLAHATSCAAVGKTAMSTPSSAMSSWAQTGPMPVTASSWATWAANGATCWSIRAVSSSSLAERSSIRSSIIRQRNP